MTTTESSDLVTQIPANKFNSGSIDLNVRSYAGYAKANFQKKDVQLFYWFFESQQFHPEKSRDEAKIGATPLIIWLNGGPGAPSTLGLFLENGPYRIQDDVSGQLTENPYSWNKEAHIIYWDQPIGTGYSNVVGEDPETTYVDNEDELSEIFYQALQAFFQKHPEYLSCPLFVTGESYAGKYVPNIFKKIHTKNEEDSEPLINLQGFSVGDGWIDARRQTKNYIDYAFTLGYLDTHEKKLSLAKYDEFCIALDAKLWKKAYDISNSIVEIVSKMGGGFNPYDIRSFSDISMANTQAYMELSAVKKALHVPEEQAWNVADNDGPVADHLIEDNMKDSSDLYADLINLEQYQVLMYTGTFDTACGSLSTEQILYDLNKWDEKDNEEWKNLLRAIWAQPSTQVKGFLKQYKNLTQIVIPNSGHQVPYFQPEVSLEMINRWMRKEPFPIYYPPVY